MNKKCQVFTPEKYVIKLLDVIEYKSDLFNKKILENSCGDGNILKEIVYRYILDCLNSKINLDKIKKGLEADIMGFEIDEVHQQNCKTNLSKIAEQFNIYDVNWNIINSDFLFSDLNVKFDYIVSNPPYINYRELDLQERTNLKNSFISCKEGKFDYCYPFIEKSLDVLSVKGKMSFLLPNSIFKNVFGENIRNIMIKNIFEIIDYKSIKLFKNAITSSTIVVFKNNSDSDFIKYEDIVGNLKLQILKKNLSKKWIFNHDLNISKNCSFSEYFKASICVATLCNSAFVINKKNINIIEKAVVRRGASPKYLKNNIDEYIIFPYMYINGKLTRYSEDDFIRNYPNAYIYLRKFKDKLDNRNSENEIKWFEYGRSQALAHINQKKLLMSTVVTKKINVYELDEDYIPYSGIYIVKNGDLDLNIAKKILESEKFLNYVMGIGINASGGSLRITVKDINNYKFNLEDIYDREN